MSFPFPFLGHMLKVPNICRHILFLFPSYLLIFILIHILPIVIHMLMHIFFIRSTKVTAWLYRLFEFYASLYICN